MDHRGVLAISSWRKDLQPGQRGAFDDKVRLLKEQGAELSVSHTILAGPVEKHLYKLRFSAGRVQLRPVLCRGPIVNASEFTFLVGAKEKGDKMIPRNAYSKALECRQIIRGDPDRRHEYDC